MRGKRKTPILQAAPISSRHKTFYCSMNNIQHRICSFSFGLSDCKASSVSLFRNTTAIFHFHEKIYCCTHYSFHTIQRKASINICFDIVSIILNLKQKWRYVAERKRFLIKSSTDIANGIRLIWRGWQSLLWPFHSIAATIFVLLFCVNLCWKNKNVTNDASFYVLLDFDYFTRWEKKNI